MLTAEQRTKIYNAGMEFYKAQPFNLETKSLQENVDVLGHGLTPLYQKLQEDNLIPEGMNFDIFMQTVIPHLQHAVDQYQFQQLFNGLRNPQ